MIKAIFFDMGGVLVELNSEAEMRNFLGDMPREEIWRRWLHSPAVREHESGRMSAEEFGTVIVRELGIDATPEAFMQSLDRWIAGPFPGAHQLLEQLSPRYRIALLTNTSAFHWQRIEATGIPQACHHVVASFQVGMFKPDKPYFEHALALAGVSANEVLFFDDNEINCEGARRCGIEAYRVLGAHATAAVLRERGLID